MVYIQTSKTRKVSPHGRTVVIRNPDNGDNRICDERYAEKIQGRNGYEEPRVIPNAKDHDF